MSSLPGHLVIVGSHAAAPDHINTRYYHHGEVYAVGSHYMPDHLAIVFLTEKWAIPTTAPKDLPQSRGADQTALNREREAELERQSDNPIHHGLVGYQAVDDGVEVIPSPLPPPPLTQAEHDKAAREHMAHTSHHTDAKTGPKETK